MQESYNNNNLTNNAAMPACNVGLFIPNAFRLKFVFADGREDISTAKLAAYLLNWHKPKIEINPDTGEKIFSNKFFGERFQTSYGFLTKELGLSKATIRRSFVKLEKYGYAKRVFENVCLCGQIYNSRLFVELTDQFKLDFGLDKKFGVILNNENGSDDRSISTNTPSSSRIGAGVINVIPPAHGGKPKYSYNKNNNIDRSRSMKSDLVFQKMINEEIEEEVKKEKKYILEEVVEDISAQDEEEQFLQQEPSCKNDITTRGVGLKLSEISKEELLNELNNRMNDKNLAIGSLAFGDNIPARELVAIKEKGSRGVRKNFHFRGKSKTLEEFYPLSDADCSILQKKSGRGFSACGINKIMLHLTKKGLANSFCSKKGVLSYMSFVLAGEIRSEEEVNKDDFIIGEVLSEEKKEAREQEKFLSEIENSLQVSPEWHLKKKLTSCLMPKVAYEFLKSAYQYARDGGTFKIFLHRKVELQESEKQIILDQVNASHAGVGSRFSFSGGSKDLVDLDGISRLELILKSGEVVSSFEKRQLKESCGRKVKGCEENIEVCREVKEIEPRVLGDAATKVVESISNVSGAKDTERQESIRGGSSEDNEFVPDPPYLPEFSNDIWGEVRKEFVEVHGGHDDKYWLKDLIPIIDEEKKELTLQAEHQLFKEFVNKHFAQDLAEISGKLGFNFLGVDVKLK